MELITGKFSKKKIENKGNKVSMGHAWPDVDCKIKLLKRGKNACILSSLNGCTSRTERTQQFRLVAVIRFILIIIKGVFSKSSGDYIVVPNFCLLS